VRGVNLALEPGRCLGIAGPNGAGKSTLLGALAGWIHPSSGEVLLHGQAVHGRVPAEVGFAAQEVSLYPHLSGRHNLELFGQLYDLSRAELVRRIGPGTVAPNVSVTPSAGWHRSASNRTIQRPRRC